MQKKFRFTANVEFEAESLDDAFQKLSEHFELLELGLEKENWWFTGSMKLEPIECEK